MRTLRFYCQTPRSDHVALDEVQSRHLSKVLRLKAGDAVEILDGKGLLAEAVIERVDRAQTTVRLVKQTHIPPKSCGRIILAVSMAKGERFDWLVEKCTELGADHIAAVQYDRTVKMGKTSTLDRCRKIALAAAKQCGRLHLPTLTGPAVWADTYAELRRLYPDAKWFYGDAQGRLPEAVQDVQARPDVAACIGPEGGFSDGERGFFADAGVCPVCIHPNVLRIETAAAAFAAILSCRLRSEIHCGAAPHNF